MMEKDFLFSVIIPVYNVEEYIEEAVNSLIQQSIGFEDHIQIILIDDGSTDGSAAICETFAYNHPDNIVYVRKENGGVSSARNEGLKHAKGKYVNFLDGDDYWEKHAFERAAAYFDSNPEVRIISGRMVLFGKNVKKPHHMDYKYETIKCVDIMQEYDYPENSVSHLFIARDLLAGRTFDERLRFSEDLLMINQILLREKKYAMLPSSEYMYRRRESGDSAINRSITQKDFYKETVDIAYFGLIEESKAIYGEVIPYIQYLLITDLQWRLNKTVPESVSEEIKGEYLNKLKELLDVIDNSIILSQRRMSYTYKCYVFLLKETLEEGKHVPDADWETLIKAEYRPRVRHLNVVNNTLHIEVRSTDYLFQTGRRLVLINEKGKEFYPEYQPAKYLDYKGAFPEVVLKGGIYVFNLPVYAGARYGFFIKLGESRIKKVPKYGQYSRLVNMRNTFFCEGKFIIKSILGRVCIYDNTLKTRLLSRYKYEKTLKKIGAENVIPLRRKAEKLKRRGKPIWILFDRTNRAGDNAEALFSYLMKIGANQKNDIYFIIDENSPDYARMKAIGPVIKAGTRDHYLMQMAASLVISSSADGWVLNPYIDDLKYYRDLLTFKYVFLQHGITQNDLSGWLNRYTKNIKLFVTAARPEYESILTLDYGFDDTEVKLTGFARYDNLTDNRKKQIAFLPTWRREISGEVIEGTATREYNPDFKDSVYCRFYNKLINDERIMEAMRRNGYTGCFYPHPSNSAQYVDFQGNDTIHVMKAPESYAKVFMESALLITDYSSVAMDFAYLKKPVIYTQFDKEVFFAEQWDKGYYDYERDGFGHVCYDYESAVEAIVHTIEGGCIEEEEYLERVRRFFAFTDRNNCKRIYDEINKLIKQ